MKIGLHVVDYTWPGEPARIGQTLAEIAGTAEEVGFAAIEAVGREVIPAVADR